MEFAVEDVLEDVIFAPVGDDWSEGMRTSQWLLADVVNEVVMVLTEPSRAVQRAGRNDASRLSSTFRAGLLPWSLEGSAVPFAKARVANSMR